MKKTSSTKSTQSSSTSKDPKGIVNQLFNSPDPLCIKAGIIITDYERILSERENEILKLYKSATVLLLSLDEIVRLSIEIDAQNKKLTEVEFKKRFSEIIHICSDAYFSYQRVMETDDETLR